LKAKHPDTLVFFFSDNGGSGKRPFFATNTGRNAPLRGDKGQTYEGGIRVPFFVSWPGKLPSGKTFDHAVSSLDVLPTSCAVAGVKPPEGIEGVNLVPHLSGEKSEPPHDMLAWRFGPQQAIRKGNYKLVIGRDFEAMQNSEWQLFDLSTDLSEKTDLAASKPELVAELKSAWEAWNTKNITPLWPGTPREDPKPAKEPAKKAK
jgi:arylsulfatase A-like enzyme